jgi:hypothetical protein
MSDQVAVGHDNTAGLATVSASKPPKTQGVQYPRYITAGSGVVYPDGAPFVVWAFEHLTAAEYVAVLTAMGLTDSPASVSADVTLRTIGHDRVTYRNYNATVVHRKVEDTNYSGGLYRRATFTFKQLEAI